MPTVELGSAPAPLVRATVADAATAADLADLIVVGRRQNPRRQVLYLSTVLGKHLSVAPGTAIVAAMALGELVAAALHPAQAATVRREQLRAALATGIAPAADALAGPAEPTLDAVVIGFAETATALGHGVRRQLGPGPIVHTTRAPMASEPLVTCQERHSHATAHAVHHHDPELLASDATVVIVDDELSTGATALDLIAAIQARWPRPRYVLASLVDWRTDAHQAEASTLADRLGTTIDAVALVRAEAEVAEAPPVPDFAPLPHRPAGPAPRRWQVAVGPPTARDGWTTRQQQELDAVVAAAAAPLAAARHGGRALVLGTEELLYVPMLLGLHLGPGVAFRSTTRSPIVPAAVAGYPIRDRVDLPTLDGTAGVRHLYDLDVTAERVDDVFVVVEAPLADDHPLLAQLGRLSRHLHVVELT